MSAWPRPILIAGVGSEAAGDDGAGLLVARQLRALPVGPGVSVIETADPAGLIAQWNGFASAIIIDAMRSGRPAGTLVEWEHDELPDARAFLFTSTHAFGVLDAIALARQLGSLPPHVVVYGIEAGLDGSDAISPPVARTIERVVAELRGIVA